VFRNILTSHTKYINEQEWGPRWNPGANGLQMIGIFVVLCSTDNLSLHKAHTQQD